MQLSSGLRIVVQRMLDIMGLVLIPRRGIQGRREIGVDYPRLPCPFGRSSCRSLIDIKLPHSHSFIARNTLLLRFEIGQHEKANHNLTLGSSPRGLSLRRGEVREKESFRGGSRRQADPP